MSTAVVQHEGRWKAAPAQVDSFAQLRAHASLVLLVKECADTLHRHYPGWVWAIRPDEGGGIIDIMCLRISSRYGYTLHVKSVQNDPSNKRVISAGGEFLERFGFRRGAYSLEEWRRREQVMGQFIPDVSDQGVIERRNVRTHTIETALKSGHARITTDPRIGAALRASRAL